MPVNKVVDEKGQFEKGQTETDYIKNPNQFLRLNCLSTFS
jgi:hypothetical protein